MFLLYEKEKTLLASSMLWRYPSLMHFVERGSNIECTRLPPLPPPQQSGTVYSCGTTKILSLSRMLRNIQYLHTYVCKMYNRIKWPI
jgi:hypothetical protein